MTVLAPVIPEGFGELVLEASGQAEAGPLPQNQLRSAASSVALCGLFGLAHAEPSRPVSWPLGEESLTVLLVPGSYPPTLARSQRASQPAVMGPGSRLS